MKTLLNALALVILMSFFACKQNSHKAELTQVRIVKKLNHDWQFKIDSANSVEWETVDIPHIPKIEPLVVNNQWQGTMSYKKTINVTSAGKKYFLNFEGLMQDAELWINEQKVAEHYGGYLPFNIDVTNYLQINTDNQIEIKLTNIDNPQTPPGKALKVLDFNTYGGIYRDANLVETNPIYITDPIIENKPASGGVLVHFSKATEKKAEGIVKIHTRNDNSAESEVFCELIITTPSGDRNILKSKVQKIEAQKDTEFKIDVLLNNPELWNTNNPVLYNLEVRLFSNNKLVDNKSLKIGIRNIELKNNGFYLNHKNVFISGTNRHQEYPYVGYAISNNANYRDAYKIKDAGFDFVRLSHYPHDNSFLDACDELGILVMNAIPGWQFFGDSTFIENSYQDIRDMVRRDRNHPCVVFWENSLNESRMTEEYINTANKILKEELPFDDTYSAGWIDHGSYDMYIPARQHGKPPYYWNNYKVNERPTFVAEYGDWEYYAQNAGFNQTSFANLKGEERSSRQLRGVGEERLLQQALNYQEATNSNKKGKATIGHANWLMFDYNRGYANDIESSGISDIFRLPKFAYYFYKSQRPVSDKVFGKNNKPFVYIANYLENTENINVKVFSNCQEVELLNGNISIGIQKPDNDDYSGNLDQAPFSFTNINTNDSLTAIGKINGHEVTRSTIYKPGDAKDIILTADISGKEIESGCNDLVFVYATIVDTNKQQIYSNTNKVSFKIEGDAKIIGGKEINAEAGIAAVLVQIGRNAGNIIVKANSGNIKGELTLEVK